MEEEEEGRREVVELVLRLKWIKKKKRFQKGREWRNVTR